MIKSQSLADGRGAPNRVPWRWAVLFVALFVGIVAGIPVIEQAHGMVAALRFECAALVGWLLSAALVVALRSGSGGRW